ncbi:MAG: hydantoinase/oxoprolinase family protein [Deltaproteobacteria bacterium]|nr:hydantoinase/oxoprolinase family protein [Deltaproteobacteria bacterium]
MGYTVDIDTGGTFTDGFFAKGDRVEAVKVPTTPHDLTVCFLECVQAGAERFGVPVEDLLYDAEIIRFSNTIGTNTLIQRDGSKVGLLVTKGREALAPTSDREGRPPLVAPDMTLGVDEAVSVTGAVLKAPAEPDVLAAAQALVDRGARCLVVAFSNSDINAANERLAQKAIKREYPRDYLGSVPVFLSSNISPRAGEAERINTAVINAYIHARLTRLLYKAGEDLRRRLYRKNLFIGHNNGAVARVAKTRAIHTYNSGPAGGLLGARLIGDLYGVQCLISADMGGTSFDLGYVRRGEPSYTLRPDVEGFPVNLPMLSIRAIGAGGGSIASIGGGELRVGPRSAGALPGPACFDLGGAEPTVTDANLALGILDADCFLGGAMKLNRARAVTVLEERLAQPLSVSVEEAALRVRKTVDETMGRETRRVKEELAAFADPILVVYGGAGPAHCCDVARIAGLRKIVITPFSAVFSAFGSSTMDVGHAYYRRIEAPLAAGADLGALARAIGAMEKEAARDLRGEGFAPDSVSSELELFVRPSSATTEVKITADRDFLQSPSAVEAVTRSAQDALAAAGAGAVDGLTVSTVSLTVRAPVPHYTIAEVPPAPGDPAAAQKGARPVFLDLARGWETLPVYDLERLGPGHTLRGPAVVESPTTTLLVQSGWRLTVDGYRNCVLEEVSR